MLQTPLFSIIIPVFNRAHLIKKTLVSVLNQTFKNYELIVVDDGSSDNLKYVFDCFVEENKISNWKYYYKPNGERGAARNFGIQKTKGQWITFLDSDDIFYINHLSIASEFTSKNSEITVFHSAYEFRNQKHELIKRINYPKNGNLNCAVMNGNLFSCFGIFIKKHVLNELKFNEDRNLSGSEDWLLWLKIAARYKIDFQFQISGCMIQHDERSVLNFSEDKLFSRCNLLVNKLYEDKIFIEKFGEKAIRKIYAHMLTYSALHVLLNNNKKIAMKLFFKGLKSSSSEFFKMRTLAIFKYLLLK
jgi:glycosyltransferase involved in cell wall biosynthesis